MKFTRFSFRKLEEICVSEAKRINATTNINLIIFIAKGGLPIAVFMSRIFKCRILPIYAARKTSIMKKLFFKIGGKFFPETLKNFLRWLEIKSGFHKRNSERHVTFVVNMTEAEKEKKRFFRKM